MKVAAYQAPLLPCVSMTAIDLVREQVSRCESQGVEILCCPEAILGGLADYAPSPKEIAIDVEAGELEEVLVPLASDVVTSIVGFTEIARDGHLYNTAAVYHRGKMMGLYRKLFPALRKSVYSAGNEMPVFDVAGLKFGIVICLDSNYLEPARIMAVRGATALSCLRTTVCRKKRQTSRFPRKRGMSISPEQSTILFPLFVLTWLVGLTILFPMGRPGSLILTG